MKIYFLSQNDNDDYDAYKSMVVCAENEEDAKSIAPNGELFKEINDETDFSFLDESIWALKLSSIYCEEIGIANVNQKRGVIIATKQNHIIFT